MDDNLFAVIVLGFGTVLIAVVIWQLLAIARARMQLDRGPASTYELERCRDDIQQLDARLTALAEDMHEMDQRNTQQRSSD